MGREGWRGSEVRAWGELVDGMREAMSVGCGRGSGNGTCKSGGAVQVGVACVAAMMTRPWV